SCLPALAELAGFPELHGIWADLVARLPAGHQPTRVYANAHTYGIDGQFHRDCPPGAGEVTSLIYLNPVWKAAWGGATLFEAQGDASPPTYVQPAPGRLVVFPGDLSHRACAPGRDCYDLRVTLVFKSR